jgi:hypothetical protein
VNGAKQKTNHKLVREQEAMERRLEPNTQEKIEEIPYVAV